MPRPDPDALGHAITPCAAVGFTFPIFSGYPYLVTRLLPNVHHYLLAPADLPAPALRTLAHRQVQANRLPTALVLDADFCVYLAPDGTETLGPACPSTGRVQSGWLLPPEPFPRSAELAWRSERLEAFEEGVPHILLEWELALGGRPVGAAEQAWLGTRNAAGEPQGLVRCATCGEWRGEALAPGEAEGYAVPVYCRCQNWNRCAACGQPFVEHRLNAYRCDGSTPELVYVPGYKVFHHWCSARHAAAGAPGEETEDASPLGCLA